MSLLEGLNDEMENRYLDFLLESDLDDAFEFDAIMESVSEEYGVELSQADIDAIMDDNNPDNAMADINGEDIDEGEMESFLDNDIAELEQLLAMESGSPEPDDLTDDPDYEPPASEGCANESDDEFDFDFDDEDDEYDDDEFDEDDDISIESILDSLSL